MFKYFKYFTAMQWFAMQRLVIPHADQLSCDETGNELPDSPC